MFSIIATSYVSLAVWLAVLGGSATVGAYDRSGLVTYFLGVSMVSMLTGAWAGTFVADSIRSGGLDPYLLKPWGYIHHFVVNNLGEKISKLTILLPMTLLLALAFRADLTWSLTWGKALLLLGSIIAGAAIALLISMCVGLLAFWTSDITGISALYLAAESLLSGRLVPLDLFPPALRRWALALPFRFTVSLPVEILVGAKPLAELLRACTGQVAWLVGLYCLYRLLWRQGLRGYSSSGG